MYRQLFTVIFSQMENCLTSANAHVFISAIIMSKFMYRALSPSNNCRAWDFLSDADTDFTAAIQRSHAMLYAWGPEAIAIAL